MIDRPNYADYRSYGHPPLIALVLSWPTECVLMAAGAVGILLGLVL